jgi:hypothetical protein
VSVTNNRKRLETPKPTAYGEAVLTEVRFPTRLDVKWLILTFHAPSSVFKPYPLDDTSAKNDWPK